ncbi:MAG: hypothetical protein AAF531_24210 [Actinomycetota bacterium]
MATGDETQAGPRPSLPPRQTQPPGPDNGIGLGGSRSEGSSFFDDDPGRTQRMGQDPSPPPATPPPDPTAAFPAGSLREPRVGQARILAPQANEWETNFQEVEVVKTNRFGLALLFLLGLLVVAIVALGLAARSVFNSGDDVATTGNGTDSATEEPLIEDGAVGADQDAEATTTTVAVPLDNQLLIALTEDPFVCDGGVRPFANLTGAAAGEQIEFTSPQSSGIQPGTAEADGTLTIRWQCDPEQVGTIWDITAAGATSGKTVTFSITGADASGATATVPGPTELTVSLIESPFNCNGETRIFGGLTGAEPNEEIAFTSPQASGLRNGQADADGSLPIRWQCDAEQAGMMWELTATGVTSGRSVTFTFSGG